MKTNGLEPGCVVRRSGQYQQIGPLGGKGIEIIQILFLFAPKALRNIAQACRASGYPGRMESALAAASARGSQKKASPGYDAQHLRCSPLSITKGQSSGASGSTRCCARIVVGSRGARR
jgi:hypothetical protein